MGLIAVVRPKTTEVMKSCPKCKRLFVSKRKDQRFCSSGCRIAFHTAINVLGVCPNCGEKL